MIVQDDVRFLRSLVVAIDQGATILPSVPRRLDDLARRLDAFMGEDSLREAIDRIPPSIRRETNAPLIDRVRAAATGSPGPELTFADEVSPERLARQWHGHGGSFGGGGASGSYDAAYDGSSYDYSRSSSSSSDSGSSSSSSSDSGSSGGSSSD